MVKKNNKLCSVCILILAFIIMLIYHTFVSIIIFIIAFAFIVGPSIINLFKYTTPDRDVREKRKDDKVVVSSIDELINEQEEPVKKEKVEVEDEDTKEYVLPSEGLLKNSKELISFVKEIKGKKNFSIPIGITDDGILIVEMQNMPNLLISGTVMTGKSTYISSILTSILLTKKPDEVKIILYDSKKVEFSIYNGVPHLMAPVVTDPRKANIVLKKIVSEMENRYDKFDETKTKNIEAYNEYIDKLNKQRPESEQLKHLPYIVVIIDDYVGLSEDDSINYSVEHISKTGWNTGIHLIIVANHPSSKIISAISKPNFPARLSFAVTSKRDSMIILDQEGAEKLTGRGSALYKSGLSYKPIKVKTPFVDDSDISNIINYVIQQQKVHYDGTLTMSDEQKKNTSSLGREYDENDLEEPLYNEMVEFVVKVDKASASLLQRRFKIGYNRAARAIDLLEERGIIGASNGAKPRKVLVKEEN